MTVQITSSTFCLCGDDMKVTASSFEAVDVLHAEFLKLHIGDGHQLFSTAAEAKQARRSAVTS